MHKKFSTMIYVNCIIWEIKLYVGKDTQIANGNVWLYEISWTGFRQFTKHWTCSLYWLPLIPDLHDYLLTKKKDWCVTASHNWKDKSCDYGLNKLKLKRSNICTKTRSILKCHGLWRQYLYSEKYAPSTKRWKLLWWTMKWNKTWNYCGLQHKYGFWWYIKLSDKQIFDNITFINQLLCTITVYTKSHTNFCSNVFQHLLMPSSGTTAILFWTHLECDFVSSAD
jgi:hypothetical protein